MKKFFMYGFGLIMVILALFFIFASGNGEDSSYNTVKVKRGSVSETALAVGTIEPDHVIGVKSAVSGIISEMYFEIGDRVEKGAVLFKISPNPTPVEYVQARRNMEGAELSLKHSERERERLLQMFKAKMISPSEMDLVNTQYNDLKLKYTLSKEQFELIEKGHGDRNTAGSIIKSPISGILFTRQVSVGDPVVPLTQYQTGTDLCSLGDGGQMLFKGSVDEIDVGKLSIGMASTIKISALPDLHLKGELIRLSPKATKDGVSRLFEIELKITESSGGKLRAGYSAISYIETKSKRDVLVLPERVVTIEKDKRWVEVKEGKSIRKVEIKSGLSDCINLEVIDGLKEGQEIVDRAPFDRNLR